jgi:hypothetical protein
MKRPQFSLLLMLLVVALSAAFFGWRHAVDRKAHFDRIEQLTTQLFEARHATNATWDEPTWKKWTTNVEALERRLDEESKQ